MILPVIFFSQGKISKIDPKVDCTKKMNSYSQQYGCLKKVKLEVRSYSFQVFLLTLSLTITKSKAGPFPKEKQNKSQYRTKKNEENSLISLFL